MQPLLAMSVLPVDLAPGDSTSCEGDTLTDIQDAPRMSSSGPRRSVTAVEMWGRLRQNYKLVERP